MARDIRFILKEPASGTLTFVYLKFLCSDGYLRYSTDQKISSARDQQGYIHWDEANQRPKFRKIDRQLDDRINEITFRVKEFQKIKNEERKPLLIDDLYNFLAAKDEKKLREIFRKNMFFEQIRQLIIEAKSGQLTRPDGSLYKHGTLKHWDLAHNILHKFNPNLSWDFTMQDYHKFKAWCNEKKLQPNYIGTILKMWKVFANHGLQRGWHNNLIHLQRDFKKLTEKKFKVALSEEQIRALIAVPLKGTDKEIRDRFIIQLNTGLRISDMNALTLQNYDDKNGIITSYNQKTEQFVAIDINDDVRRIMEEYNGFPRAFTEQAVNRTIKQVALLAGFVQQIRFTETRGGVKQVVEVPLWKLISSHTGRRSFITNEFKKNTPIADISKLAGSTIKNLEHYNKTTSLEVAQKRAEERQKKRAIVRDDLQFGLE